MKNRIAELVRYAAGGKQTEFAEMLGWSPQYLSRLLSGGSGVGIRPVVAILERFPEVDARWLLLGEGSMIRLSGVVDEMKQHLSRLIELERFLPVMSAEEIHEVVAGRVEFDDETIARWSSLLENYKNESEVRLARAYQKQKELCKTRKV